MNFKKTAIASASVAVLGLSVAACGDNADDVKSSATSAADQATSAAASAANEAKDKAQSSNEKGLTFEDRYCKTKPAKDQATGDQMGDMTACFGNLENNTDKDITIESFSIKEIADKATFELHEVVNGVMREKEGGFTIPAGEDMELKPGAEHLMIMNFDDELAAGEDLTVQVTTTDGETFEFTTPVREVAAGNESYGGDEDGDTEGAHEGHDHEGHDHDGHEHHTN